MSTYYIHNLNFYLHSVSTADKFKGQAGFIFTVDLKNMMEMQSSYVVPIFRAMLVHFVSALYGPLQKWHPQCALVVLRWIILKIKYKTVALTSAVMSLNLVMKACLTMSTVTSDVITMKTSGSSTQR